MRPTSTSNCAIFNNNLELVIGAYNGGEGAHARRVGAAGGTQSFWDPKIYYDVSQETREYVPMVLAAAWLFLHPERYNLRVSENRRRTPAASR